MKVRALQGDTVDALCWRHLGRTQGVVEATLELNKGLAASSVLAAGQLVELAEPAASTTTTRSTVQLWE
ncbi:tail protein X [Rubrivivax gelatinosus]|uniref:Phage tail protein n=1 Tax=Rubrivivax gelatinosus TaxID=28068 RepID=A0ABS1DMS0_RUBGE|nr:tail protein X [Rubrivivax gelatinosus]MBK1711312.1 phage tail protein [Rubrivivax gelatinosus]